GYVVPTQLKLVHDMLEVYDKKAKPTWINEKPVNVTFSMDLYQILELNEPQQYILLNAWIIERWYDEFLFWHPMDYDNITELRLPYDSIWLPDTTLYNSLVMKDEDSRRLLNAKLTTNTTRRATLIELLYPTIYKFSCLLNLRFFPFDVQICTMTFSSWTHDQKGIDYFPFSKTIGISNYIENEGWCILRTEVKRKEVKYPCCPNKYTMLYLTLYLRRKPLFYIVNLIIPTSIITLIAIVGFFTTSSTSGMREEKVSLGITTLLSMSILMLMVSDQMPTTSSFIPLIGWFILGMIVVISLGTLASSVIIAIQKRGHLGERLSLRALRITKIFAFISLTDIPLHLIKGTKEFEEAPLPNAYQRSIKISKKLSLHSDPKKSWFSFMNTNNSPIHGSRGMSMLSDKSTDLLMSSSALNELTSQMPMPPSNAEEGQLSQDVIERDASSVLLSPSPPPPPPPPPPSQLVPFSPITSPLEDEPNSAAESDIGELNTAPSGVRRQQVRSDRGNIFKHLNVFTGNVKQSRKLAVKEYEWLATIVERCCFIVFVIIFLIVTFGINAVGYYHWRSAEQYRWATDEE
uniref:Uncharacterized protein n=1 Tax=Parascaris univalens TaxID=6257 RepID=A0A915BC53_PARUN